MQITIEAPIIPVGVIIKLDASAMNSREGIAELNAYVEAVKKLEPETPLDRQEQMFADLCKRVENHLIANLPAEAKLEIANRTSGKA